MQNGAHHTPLRILVTDAQELAALGAIRSLGRVGHEVVAACPRRFGRPAAAWSRYCTELRASPDPWRSHGEFRRWLEEQILEKQYDAILPISEGAIQAVAALRPQAPPGTLLLLPDDASLALCLSKFTATQRALALGIPCPATVFIEDGLRGAALERALAGLRYPVIIKTDNALTPGGAYRKGRNRVAANPAGALAILRELERDPARRIVQELIPGSGAGAFFLRWGGRVVLEFAHRRLHEVPYSGGMSSLRESCHEAALLEAGRRLLEGVDYQGLAMVEFRRSAADGKLHFLEINGRLWGSLALALHAGVDFPRALLECHQGPPAPAGAAPHAGPAQYPDGLRCRNFYPGECAYLFSILTARPEAGTAPPPPLLRTLGHFLATSLNPRVRDDHFWWSDPAPAAAQALSLGRRILGRGRGAALGVLRQRQDRLAQERLRARHAARIAAGFNPAPAGVLFLCYGNICRSPFAEAYWNARRSGAAGAMLPPAASAGFYPQAGRSTPAWILDLAAEHGVDLAGHRSRLVTPQDVERAGAILIMDRMNERDLMASFPACRDKMHYLGAFAPAGPIELADPFMEEEDEARACYARLVAALEGLIGVLRRPAGGGGRGEKIL